MFKDSFTFRYPWLLTMLNAVLGALFILSLLMTARDILTFRFAGRNEGKTLPVRQDAAGDARRDISEYADILRNNPFGFPGGQLTPLSARAGAAAWQNPVSLFDARLIGTVAGASAYSYAIFLDKSGRQEIFRLGESVFGAGKLRKIEKERVFIAGNSGLAEVQIADIVAIKDVTLPSGSAGGGDFARSTGSGSYIVDQKKIFHALENPGQLMTDVRLQPNIVNGQHEGFILREVRSGGIYQSLGLQNGDVLLRINDYNVTNPEIALQAFTALRGMDRVQLDIVRGGSKMTMTYLIR